MQETRFMFIKRALRQIYNDQPSDDSNITTNLVNMWLGDAIGVAAKKNYIENNQLDGISYVNNSFYTSFTLPIVNTSQFGYQVTLPQIPFGIGQDEGVSSVRFVDQNGNTSDAAVALTKNQGAYYSQLRPIPNKILYLSEGIFLYITSTIQLQNYTAKVRMISGGDNTNLNSILNVPDDFKPIMIEYIKTQLAWERAQMRSNTNDGSDA